MEGGINSEVATTVAIAAGFVFTVILLAYAILRARKARQKQIEEAGEDRPRPPKKPSFQVEDLVPEKEKPSPSGDEKPSKEKDELKELLSPSAKPEAIEEADASLPLEKPKSDEISRIKAKTVVAFSSGLAKTKAGWIARLGQLFVGKREIDPSLVEEIEKVLLTADIGVRTSQKLLDEIRSSLSKHELSDPTAIWTYLKKRSIEFLKVEGPRVDFAKFKPFVLLIIGVNGSGKTTTIGKLASNLIAEGKKVLLAAGDTFRAAATEQLEVWGERAGAVVVRGKEGSDPSSVIFDGIKRAINEGIEVVIADTAGRLHTKTNLMEELQKVRRVVGKALEGAPHETWLVIDSTSGQNAIAQAQIFTQAMSVTGIVLTKLDGTAKGGVILGITDQLKIPVRYIGIGERVEDLREFDAEEFVEALYENTDSEQKTAT
jgi:fused signal recognition particle receptor